MCTEGGGGACSGGMYETDIHMDTASQLSYIRDDITTHIRYIYIYCFLTMAKRSPFHGYQRAQVIFLHRRLPL